MQGNVGQTGSLSALQVVMLTKATNSQLATHIEEHANDRVWLEAINHTLNNRTRPEAAILRDRVSRALLKLPSQESGLASLSSRYRWLFGFVVAGIVTGLAREFGGEIWRTIRPWFDQVVSTLMR